METGRRRTYLKDRAARIPPMTPKWHAAAMRLQHERHQTWQALWEGHGRLTYLKCVAGEEEEEHFLSSLTLDFFLFRREKGMGWKGMGFLREAGLYCMDRYVLILCF